MRRFSRVLPLAAVAMAAFALATPANGGLWTPANTTTGLWLDAADASTVTAGGGQVSQWNDKSGNGRNATQVNGANQPAYVLGGLNSQNIVQFNGSSSYLNMGTGLNFLAGVDHKAFIVHRINNNDYSNLYGAANGGNGNQSLHVGFRNASSYRINYWGNDYNPPITANYDKGDFNFNRWEWPVGRPKSVYANAELEGTGGPNAGNIAAMSGGGRIVNVVGQGLAEADIAEIVMVTGAPSPDIIDNMEGYLAWKWGLEGKLPSGHPYESAAPTVPLNELGMNVEVYDGTNASMSSADAARGSNVTGAPTNPADNPGPDTITLADIGSNGDGSFPGRNPVPSPGGGNSYAVCLTGYLEVDNSSNPGGLWTFGTFSDDNSRIRIDLNQNGILEGSLTGEGGIAGETVAYQGSCCGVVLGSPVALANGFYAFEAAFTEGGGGDYGEFFYAPGNPGFNTTNYALIGDSRLGISAVLTNIVPEPTTLLTWSLLSTLGIILGWRRRRR